MNKVLATIVLAITLSGCNAAVDYALQEQGYRKSVDKNVKYCTSTVGNVTKWYKCGYK